MYGLRYDPWSPKYGLYVVTDGVSSRVTYPQLTQPLQLDTQL